MGYPVEVKSPEELRGNRPTEHAGVLWECVDDLAGEGAERAPEPPTGPPEPPTGPHGRQ